MKYSKYNLFLKHKDNYIGFNFITKIMFTLEESNYFLLKKYLNNPMELKNININLFNILQKFGILVDSELPEIHKIRVNNRKAIFDQRYRITIIPTLDCNFNCWYCYETHTKEIISQKTIASIYKHLKNTIANERLNGIELDWFGGEPLLCFDNVIYPVSKKIIKMAAAASLKFTHVITTNGYLITDEMVQKFNEIKLKNFQITLDGIERIHNKVKKTTDGSSAYTNTVRNINYIIENIPDSSILLRINFTDQNLKSIKEIISDFPTTNRKNIKLLFQEVWQLENKNDKKGIDEILKYFEENQFQIEFRAFNKEHLACYADRYYQAVINHNGDVFKCTARDFNNKKYRDGILTKSGDIIWEDEKFIKRLGNSTIDNKFCINCKYLPLCYGPCSQKQMELVKSEDFKSICFKEGLKKSLKKLMIDYYETTYEKSNIKQA